MIKDLSKFRASNWERRTASVKIPALSGLYDDPTVLVQNLTGAEVYEAEGRVRRNADISETVRKIASAISKEKAEGIVEALGISDTVPSAMVKAIAYIEFGTVEPKFDQSDAVKLAEISFDAFFVVFRKIDELTAAGAVMMGESIASGPTEESATR